MTFFFAFGEIRNTKKEDCSSSRRPGKFIVCLVVDDVPEFFLGNHLPCLTEAGQSVCTLPGHTSATRSRTAPTTATAFKIDFAKWALFLALPMCVADVSQRIHLCEMNFNLLS